MVLLLSLVKFRRAVLKSVEIFLSGNTLGLRTYFFV